MGNIASNVVSTLMGSAITGLFVLLIRVIRSKRIACQIDILLMRCLMILNHDMCELKGYRTQFNDNIFYEMFEIYTKKLKQNSYICQEVEPSYREIEKK